MKNFLKEPLVHFLLIGVGLFLLYSFLNPNEEQIENNIIKIDTSDIERLKNSYRQNWNRPPDSISLKKLIEEEIKAEVFYREALRMQLDHNDEIIRRRLKQKYEFLVKDLADSHQPSDKVLEAFYEDRSEFYQEPTKLSFSQIYFSPEKQSLPLKIAQNTLKKISNLNINKVKVNELGDPFHLQSYFSDRDFNDVRQLFGQDFATAIFDATQKGWTPPIKSGYGIHLVYVSNIEKTRKQAFETVKDKVLLDWKIEQQQSYNDRLYENLLKKYEVEIVDDGR